MVPMSSRDGPPVSAVDRGLGILAAWVGAVVGGVAVSLSALLMARAVGVDGSVADYGLPYYLLLGGTCVGAAIGCYLALRVIGQGLAAPTSAILLALLAVPGVLAATRTRSGPGWPSAWEWAVGIMMFVGLPFVAPAIAAVLAEALTRRRASG